MQRSGFPTIDACLSDGGLMLATGTMWCPHMDTGTWSEGLCTWNLSNRILEVLSLLGKHFLIYLVQGVVQFL